MRAWLSIGKLPRRYTCAAAIAAMSLAVCAGAMANTLFTAGPQISTEPVPGPDNQYGYTVAISADGMRAIVGVPYASITVNGITYTDAGKVYVLGYNTSGVSGGSWSLIKELDNPNPETDDFFGQAAALSPDGHTALIGAPGATLKGTSGSAANAGKAYFYNDSGGSWTEIQELDDTPANGGGPAPNDQFGYAVALGGSGSALVALIGAPGTTVVCTSATNCSSTAGAVYLYDVTNGTAAAASPAEFQDPDALSTTSNGADNGYRFGAALAISADGGTALFGAPYASTSATAAGKMYLSALTGTAWGALVEADDPVAIANDHFGGVLALSGNGALLLAGVPDAASAAGIAYLYSWNGSALDLVADITESGGQVAGDRFAAALGFSGDSSLAIIGSPGTSVSATNGGTSYTSAGAGKGYVYSVGTWSAPAYTLSDPDALNATANGAAAGFGFGSAVALSAVNGTALVGVPKAMATSEVVAGSADFYFNPVDLSLQLSANPSPAPLGGQFSYLFTVTNQGVLTVNGVSQTQTTNATNVVLTDTLPAGVSFKSVFLNPPSGTTGFCVGSGNTETCTLSSLQAGGVWQPSITVTTGASPSVVDNQNAAVSADQLETNSADNNAGVNVTVDDAPSAVSNAAASAIPVHVSYSGNLPVTLAYSNQPLTYSLVSNPANGTVVLDPASGAYTYNASNGYGNVSGGQPDSFTFSANDGYLNSNTARVYLQVYAAPTASDAALTVHVKGSGQLSATDPDPSQTPVFSLVVLPAHGSVALNSTTGNYIYTSTAGYTGSDRFAFNAKDSYNPSNTATVNLTVYAAPTAKAASYSVNENQLIHAALAVSEPDPTQTLTYTIVQQPAHGSVLLDSSSGAFTYAPTPNYAGNDSFTFDARDSFNTSNQATVTLMINSVPPPVPTQTGNNSGGGALDWLTLVVLGGLACSRRRFVSQ